MKIGKKKILWALVVAIVLLVAVAQGCYWAVAWSASGRLYDSVDDVPYNDVGMVLGTGPKTITGQPNLFFKYRIDATEELYKAGKIKYILISGDNSRKDYSEPDMMRDSLLACGIPQEVIYLDYAGLRTWDSVVRAMKVFGQKKMTVISQQFHNERSIFIGDRFGMDLIGFNAKNTPMKLHMTRSYLRENLARVKVVIDWLTGKQPHFLGEPIEIGEGKPQQGTNAAQQPLVTIVSDSALTIYYPNYSKIDLVCAQMPKPEDERVLFCCEAAFTGEERLKAKAFQHSHIAGNHVSGGKLLKGYHCIANTGYFAYYADSGVWQFAHGDCGSCLDRAVKEHGMAFGQTMIIYDGKDVHEGRPLKDTAKNQYRALCEIDGKLCVADAKRDMAYKDFIKALTAAGAKHALYLDMGKGWNYSFYRDSGGKARFIHNQQIPYTTNWLTFYK